MSEFLRGNFKVKNEVMEVTDSQKDEAVRLAETLRARVLTSLGGSMVYMERTALTWDGELDKGSGDRG